ncbi:threonine/serine ThrE exporter family protein [Nocardioides kribbensis]|uniref:Threonine/serine exporter family protein n=1 Tax=Nocardioides kribbensis TaxID=305517 RepID=A0ABV1NWM4_9ACTN
MSENRELNLTLDFCLRVGEVLLSSGAGAADVTATMLSLARALGFWQAECDITFTSLEMSHQTSPDEPPVIATRQVKQRVIDYQHLTRVDHLVRDVLREDLDLRQARAELGRIVSTGHDRPRWAVTGAWAAMSAGVAMQLGGDAAVVVLALLSAVTIDRLQLRMAKRRMPAFYQQVAGAGAATLIAAAAAASPLSIDVSLVITANIVMLLAGVGFMGGLQDALTGFYITAGARLTEAILATAGIIAGVSGGLSLANVVGVQIPEIDPGRVDIQSVGLMIVGSALAAAAFAFASYSPGRILAPIAGIAAVAMGISTSLAQPGLGRAWSVGTAAFFVGLVAFAVAGRMRVPPLVVVVSAIVPMLPGISIYRGLTLLAEGGRRDSSEGLLAMVTAASVAIALAAGVILGEYVAQPLKREAQKLEVRLSGPRLVGPVRVRSRRPGSSAQTSRRGRSRARAEDADDGSTGATGVTGDDGAGSPAQPG